MKPKEKVAAVDIALSLKENLKARITLPVHSPQRKVILNAVTRHQTFATNEELAQFLGVSTTSISEGKNLNKQDKMLSMKYPPNVIRERISSEQLELVRLIQDQLVPATSGRYFRVLKSSEDAFYKDYIEELEVSLFEKKPCVLKTILINVHHFFFSFACSFVDSMILIFYFCCLQNRRKTN